MTPGFLKGRDPDHSIVIYIFYIPIGTFSMSVVFNGEFAVIFFAIIFLQGFVVIPQIFHVRAVSYSNRCLLSLSAGSLFTFGAGPSNSTIIEARISIDTNSTAAPNTSMGSSATTGSASTTTITTTSDVPVVKSKSQSSRMM